MFGLHRRKSQEDKLRDECLTLMKDISKQLDEVGKPYKKWRMVCDEIDKSKYDGLREHANEN